MEEALGIGGNVPVQLNPDTFTSFGPIRAFRGKRFSYNGVRLALTSECDDGVSTRKAVDGAVYYNLRWAPQVRMPLPRPPLPLDSSQIYSVLSATSVLLRSETIRRRCFRASGRSLWSTAPMPTR